MLSGSMLSVVFRLLNFALFIALLIYGFKRYVYQAVIAQMAEREKTRKELEDKKESLAQMQARLDEQMHTNERVHKELMATLHTWQRSFERNQHELHEEKARIKYQLELKMEHRRHVQLLNQVQDEVIVPVIEQTHHAARDYFAQPEHGKAYLKELLAYMDGES
jgi:hypothetical protein